MLNYLQCLGWGKKRFIFELFKLNWPQTFARNSPVFSSRLIDYPAIKLTRVLAEQNLVLVLVRVRLSPADTAAAVHRGHDGCDQFYQVDYT